MSNKKFLNIHPITIFVLWAILCIAIITINFGIQYKKPLLRLMNRSTIKTIKLFVHSKENPKLNQLEQVRASHKLRVGLLDTPSVLYVDYFTPNELGGFEFELIQQFAKSLHVTLVPVRAKTIDDLITLIQQDKIDFIATEITFVDHFADDFIATIPYYLYSFQFIYKNGSAIPSDINSLKGTLCLSSKSYQAQLLSENKNVKWQSFDADEEALLKKVVTNECNYTIVDNRILNSMQRIFPNLTYAFEVKSDIPESWYFKKENDVSLLNIANQFIQTSLNNGDIDDLTRRYLTDLNKHDYVDTRAFIRSIENDLPLFESYFKQYGNQFNIDWKIIAAMAYQESHWNSDARSKTGVRGIMQLTTNTAESMGVEDRTDPGQSIYGGVKYLSKLLDKIPQTVPENERILFALAAYNVGPFHLFDAMTLTRELGKDPNRWQDVRESLPLISKRQFYKKLKYGSGRGYQAVDYVDSILHYHASLVGYLYEKENQINYIISKQFIALWDLNRHNLVNINALFNILVKKNKNTNASVNAN